jgi:hypothetical protein
LSAAAPVPLRARPSAAAIRAPSRTPVVRARVIFLPRVAML